MEVNNCKYKKLFTLNVTFLELSQVGSHYFAKTSVFDRTSVPI